jgi:hypothetical protein
MFFFVDNRDSIQITTNTDRTKILLNANDSDGNTKVIIDPDKAQEIAKYLIELSKIVKGSK